MSRRLTIVGGGLAGSLLSIYLARRGYDVTVYESRPDLRIDDLDAGRSINLALAARGIAALTEVGVMADIEPMLIPMRGRMIHDREGNTTFQAYGSRPHEMIYSVSRPELTAVLLTAAEASGRVNVEFNQRCLGGDLEAGTLDMHDYRTGRDYAIEVGTLFGTDGSASAVRDLVTDTVDIEPLGHSYKELTMPATADGGHAMEVEALHIWPRNDYMLIALPDPGGTYTCTLFLANEGDPSFDTVDTPEAVEALFTTEFSDFVAMTPDYLEQFLENPTGHLATVRCDTWVDGDRALILGDAAHAIVPFHGSGMNAAFESCDRLDEYLAMDDWSEAFDGFQRSRKPDTDAIAEMALDNYIQMRSSVIDERYLLKRELALELERRWPDRFIPRYSMVMFHTMPYAEAQERAGRQDVVMEQLLVGVASLDEVDFELADRLLA